VPAGPFQTPRTVQLRPLSAGADGLVGKEGFVGEVDDGELVLAVDATAPTGIITHGGVEGAESGRARGEVRAAVGAGGWSEGDSLTVDDDGRLVEAGAGATAVATALEDGIEDDSALIWWPPDNATTTIPGGG
jgi:hypothetical protein